MASQKNTQAKEQLQAIEEQRQVVLDLEMKARYWKAQHDIRFYTLQTEKLQPEYEAYTKLQKEREDQFKEDMRQQLITAGLINEDGTPKSQEEAEQFKAQQEAGSTVDDNLTEEDVVTLQQEFKENAIV